MPIREQVSEELLAKMQEVLNNTMTDYKAYKCNSTIAMLLIHLYEVAIVTFTLHYSCGTASYSVVKSHLPNLQTNQEYVKFRDDLVHNLNKINDFKERLSEFLRNFTRDNFNRICEECKIEFDLYEELLQYCIIDEKLKPITSCN